MKNPLLSLLTFSAVIALGASVIAAPIFAQQRDRPSRQCVQEIRELCGPLRRGQREAVRSCLREKFGELSSGCSAELAERFQQRRGQSASTYQAIARVDRTVIYGEHQRQQVDVFEPDDAVEELPLVVFIHGGGWAFGSHKNVQAKPAHFNQAGYYFASTGYRVLPDAPVEDQAADVGAALQALRGQASAIGFDPDRIVLMGHSAGAHLAALVATNAQYSGDAFGAIRGVVLLDGAGYDVAANMAGARPQAWQLYNNAFGTDPARQSALSPVTHVGGPDAPNWLALYVEERDTAREQSQLLVNGLIAAGKEASALPITGTDHGRMNRELGTEAGAAQTQAVDAFLASVFG